MKNFKKFLSLILVALLLLITACSNEESSKDDSGDAEKETVNRDEKLIVYTNANSDGRGEWLVEKAKEEGFNIEIVGAGGGDLTNRLISEKANPVADVVYGLNHMFFEQLQAEDVLIPYEPKWAGEVEEGINDPDNYYHGLVKVALIMAYNADVVDSVDLAKGYLEIADNADFKGVYQARDDLGAATSKVIVASILSNFADPNGELGISDEGWKYIEKFYENGVQIPEGEDYYSMLSSGKAPIGTIISGELAAKIEQYGVEPSFIHPEQGTPQVVESVAIVKGTKKEALAQEFIDWMGSADVQGEFAAQFNAMPANVEARDNVTDFLKEVFADVKQQDIDWEFVTENIDAWVEKLELEIF
ncbi:extracellular solute-binding protein [Fredinandcohnia humi]